MFLRSLTLKGFKSFAEKTTLEFEPGVAVVVGPNGSGKSNLVDAVAWVLGAQGARALRGGKMDDVIFAGTADRPALGRAEVSLTIDNASQLLPIEFSEVTITRTLFRTGESEYAINGAPCRLLDVQDLLSDSGIGRQQHVIVGQGQLDAVLNARPEDRRAIIEEAAGVLKYRKRKEKAERRLEATEANLLRLTDLLREVRRQLRPLERQADAARRHDGLTQSLQEIRLYVAGRDIEVLTTRLERRRGRRAELGTGEAELRARLRVLDADVVSAEHDLSRPDDDDVADLLMRVESARERGRGLQALVAERARGLERELAAAADEGVVETLVADAAAVREELETVDADRELLRPLLDTARSAAVRADECRAALEDAAGPPPDARRAAEEAFEAATDRWREALATFDTLRARIDALTADAPAVREQLTAAQRALADLEPERRRAHEARSAAAEVFRAIEATVEPEHGTAGDERRSAEQAHEGANANLRTEEAEAARWHARAETLAAALADEQAAAGGDAIRDLPGVLGPLLDHLDVVPGAESAVEAALGPRLHALVVDGGPAARAAVERLHGGEASALLLVADRFARPTASELTHPSEGRPLIECVRSRRPDLDAVVRALLAGVVLVENGWRAALDLALDNPEIVAVTPDGDRFGGPTPWRTGPAGKSAVTPSTLADARARADDAEAGAAAARNALASARRRLETAREAEADARRQRQREYDEARRSLVAAESSVRDTETALASASERRASLEARLAELEPRLLDLPARAAEAEQAVSETDAIRARTRRALDSATTSEREALAARRVAEARYEEARGDADRLRHEAEVRAAGIDERRGLLTRRLTEIEQRLAARPDEEAAAQERRARLQARAAAVQALGARLRERLRTGDALAERLRRRRERESEVARAAGRRLDALRTERSEAERRLGELREQLNRLELEEAETRMRLEAAVENLRREFECEPAVAIAAPAPELPEGTTAVGRSRELERELRLLGPVNPLALGEYEALQERHEFLEAQLDDVKSSRRELARVIRTVDAEIVVVFEAAFADVAANFANLFGTLFPGGSGRLTLTDPADPLSTGIEIEARPSGKNVRRLSLLSGGERSLTALAYLFSVFRARPSPFYLMDEVEAALDDVNLHRFLDLLHEFRDEAQLVVVSHQKRTMEAADVLYGVSLPPGGSSRVVSQRMRELDMNEFSPERLERA
jgi:chromosome segregation protein